MPLPNGYTPIGALDGIQTRSDCIDSAASLSGESERKIGEMWIVENWLVGRAEFESASKA